MRRVVEALLSAVPGLSSFVAILYLIHMRALRAEVQALTAMTRRD